MLNPPRRMNSEFLTVPDGRQVLNSEFVAENESGLTEELQYQSFLP
jgi:hypothetical protein